MSEKRNNWKQKMITLVSTESKNLAKKPFKKLFKFWGG